MRVRFTGFAILGTMALGLAGGCQNALHDENVKLREQNRELQARLDERSTMQAQPAPEIVKPPEPEPAPRPAPPAPPIAKQPDPVLPPPPVAPPADALAGLDTKVDLQAGTTTVNFVGDALFDSGQATLKETAKASLNKVADALKTQFNGKTVKVQGHTDIDPIRKSKWKDNQELSQARASAVRDYLVSKGVDAGVVSAEGFGATKPKDPGNKSVNRRVEIVVLTRD